LNGFRRFSTKQFFLQVGDLAIDNVPDIACGMLFKLSGMEKIIRINKGFGWLIA
jgi:hypothetical protein